MGNLPSFRKILNKVVEAEPNASFGGFSKEAVDQNGNNLNQGNQPFAYGTVVYIPKDSDWSGSTAAKSQKATTHFAFLKLKYSRKLNWSVRWF